MVSIIFSFYFYIFKLNLKTLSSCVSVDKLVDSVWDSLLELIEVSASDEVETSLVEGSLELEFVDELVLPADKAVYLGAKDTDGSWRIIRDGDNLEFQRRESGNWIMKNRIQP
jgi:hypothetical protein